MTSASVATMAERPAVTLAAFGLASGILSATLGFMFEPPWLEPIADLFWLEPGMMPIGLFYGVALGLGLMLCTGRQLAAPLVLVTTLYRLERRHPYRHCIVKLGDGTPDTPRNLVAGVAAGAIGAGLTHIGATPVRRRAAPACAASRSPRGRRAYAARSIAWKKRRSSARTLLFVWQPAVAFCIGLGMPRRERAALGPPATSAPRRP